MVWLANGRYEPGCDGWALAVVGRAVSGTPRECRQGHVAPSAPWRPLAQNRTGAVRVGSHPQQEQLSPRPVRKTQSPARPEKGHHCGGRMEDWKSVV